MAEPLTPEALAFAEHDHERCAATTLAEAARLAEERGARLTPVRRRALEVLLEAHRALGAYEVLDRLAESGFGRQPPVAYRALEFLVEQGFAHRIQRLNAFTACLHPGDDHSPAFFICRSCDHLAEVPGERVLGALTGVAEPLGFAVERATVEAVGLCPACREDRA